MSDSTVEDKKQLSPKSGQAWWPADRRTEIPLPPPSSGKELSEFLDKFAETLTEDDLKDLDRAIKASRESSR